MNTTRSGTDGRTGHRRLQFLAFWLAGALLVGGLARSQAATTTVSVGELAHDAVLVDRRTGLPLRLYDFAGSVVVVDFCAYWCGPCIDSMPVLDGEVRRYYQERGGNDHGVPVVVLPVTIGGGNEAATLEFLQYTGIRQAYNDYGLEFYGQFFGTENLITPALVVLNGYAAAPGLKAWEVLHRSYGFPGVKVIRNTIDSVRSNRTIEAPRIQTSPSATVLSVGGEHQFQVAATGSPPLRYQWFQNGVAVPGATGSSWTLTQASRADSGYYWVRIDNDGGFVRSEAVRVRVAEAANSVTVSPIGLPAPIPDGTGAPLRSTCVVSAPGVVLGVRVSLRIGHSYRGDLRAFLRSPDGRESLLIEASPDSGRGVSLTSQPVSGFGGTPMSGNWELRVEDINPGDEGRLDSWLLELIPARSARMEAFEKWIAEFQGLPDPQRVPEADPDRDGLPNLIEFVLDGKHPARPDPGSALGPVVRGSEVLEWELRWRPGVDIGDCEVLTSENLTEGPWIPAHLATFGVQVDSSAATRTKIRMLRGFGSRFIRLRVWE